MATEFMGTSISTGGDPGNPFVRFHDDPNNPHVLFRNNNRGYVRCTLTPTLDERVTGSVETVTQPVSSPSTLATYVIPSGRVEADLVAPG